MDKKEKESKKILKKMNAEKIKNDKKAEKKKNKKTPKENVKSFFGAIKEYCIKDTSRMLLLVAVLIALYIVLNLWLKTINLAQIDLTQGKLHTLTDQSKSIARTVDKEMTFYVWKYSEDSSVIDLLKQYQSENDKIKYKIVTSDDFELIETYGFENDYPAIIGVASDGRVSYINNSDLYSYDESLNMVDLTEQKITNAINNLSVSETTKVYFLEGKTEYKTTSGMTYLAQALQNEYYEVGTVDLISNPTIPDDCDVLAIMGLSSDLSETEANSICSYIEKGGDMIITNDIDYVNSERNYPNFQKVLDEYAISMPNEIISEQSSNAVSGYEFIIQSEIASDNEITSLMYNNSLKPLLIGSGIIELDSTKMLQNNITATPILMTSSGASLLNFKTKEVISKDSNTSYYVTGASIKKTVESGDESRAVVFASTSSFSDNSLDGSTPVFYYTPNYNIIMNSFAFASNRGELYSIRKTSSYVKFEKTEKQDAVVRVIICAVPVAIAVLGVCVWISRRRLK